MAAPLSAFATLIQPDGRKVLIRRALVMALERCPQTPEDCTIIKIGSYEFRVVGYIDDIVIEIDPK